MNTSQPIGIVGLGDLGGRLWAQAEAHGIEAVGFTLGSPKIPEFAVSKGLDISGIPQTPHVVDKLGDLIAATSNIHWCAPVDAALKDVQELPTDKTIFLHNSTMDESVRGREELLCRSGVLGMVVVVHCLMNKENIVAIANDFGDTEEVSKHFKEIGLNSEGIGYEEHDFIMAHSQGIFALLIEMGMGERLREWGDRGLLVPSAREVQAAVTHRELTWTGSTIQAILANKYLIEFAEEIVRTAKVKKAV